MCLAWKGGRRNKVYSIKLNVIIAYPSSFFLYTDYFVINLQGAEYYTMMGQKVIKFVSVSTLAYEKEASEKLRFQS